MIGIYCSVSDSGSAPANTSQFINQTLDAINNKTISPTDIYYAAAITYAITKNASVLDPPVSINIVFVFHLYQL